MSFRTTVANLNQVLRPISLATHLGTEIPNQTMPATQRRSAGQVKGESRFKHLLQRRPPISGYNCFGTVFASRRTSIYDNKLIEVILREDGYDVVPESEARHGDVVVYSDKKGPVHAARVERSESALVNGTAITLVVLSKFSDMTGEYEHRIGDFCWNSETASETTYLLYRERARLPQQWQAVVHSLLP